MNSLRSFPIIFCLSSVLTLSITSASLAADDAFVMRCGSFTPEMSGSDYPGKDRLIMSNNLVKPAGKSVAAAGQLLHIKGRVLDEKCVPVIGALIDIWQADPFGHYHFATQEELLNPYPIFAGTGRATTDNLGRYHFETLFPSPYGKNAPHVHFRVTHPKFESLSTSMYFAGDQRNYSDPRFRAMNDKKQAALSATTKTVDSATNAVLSEFNIILRGEHAFREF